jgi:hypothetical protein
VPCRGNDIQPTRAFWRFDVLTSSSIFHDTQLDSTHSSLLATFNVTDLEFQLRLHCQKLRVVEKLSGAHLLLPESSLAVRAYYPCDLPSLEQEASKDAGGNLDGLQVFLQSFRLAVVLFVLPVEAQRAQLDNPQSIFHRAQRIVNQPSRTSTVSAAVEGDLIDDPTKQSSCTHPVFSHDTTYASPISLVSIHRTRLPASSWFPTRRQPFLPCNFLPRTRRRKNET